MHTIERVKRVQGQSKHTPTEGIGGGAGGEIGRGCSSTCTALQNKSAKQVSKTSQQRRLSDR